MFRSDEEGTFTLKLYHFFKKLVALLFFILFAGSLTAQITPQQVQELVNAGKYSAEVKAFYRSFHDEPAWIQTVDTLRCITLLNALQNAPVMGLRQQDYAVAFIEPLCNRKTVLKNLHDSLEAELRITEAALHFYHDVAYGNTTPVFGYNGLKEYPLRHNIPVLLAEFISAGKLSSLPFLLSPPLPEITTMEKKLKWLYSAMRKKDFMEVPVVITKTNNTNKSLFTRCYQLGITDTVALQLPDSLLKQLIKTAQAQFNLAADGKPGPALVRELNVPVAERIKQLNLSINDYRWLYAYTQKKPAIVVNLPAAYLKVYNNHEVMLEMKVIVGKTTTPTPTLASMVEEVVLYPYWHVPHSIATKELLPQIKRNPGFIDAGNYQVLNAAGKIVNPYAVNWRAYSAGNFPYLIRQSTGCDNALGLIKLNFYNPFGVYLHDTPTKKLFKQQRRFFSHGCMRMEKPMEIGHFILNKNGIAIDTLEEKGCIRNQSPVTVSADVRMPVIVWYNPAGIDAAGQLIFFEDVYGRFKRLK